MDLNNLTVHVGFSRDLNATMTKFLGLPIRPVVGAGIITINICVYVKNIMCTKYNIFVKKGLGAFWEDAPRPISGVLNALHRWH